MSQAKAKKTPTTKEGMGLCQHRGCREERYPESHFCGFHISDFWHIDAAYKVNVVGTNKPLHGIFRKARDERKKIRDAYYASDVDKTMKDTLLAEPTNILCICRCSKKGHVSICHAPVKHQGNLCPRHLRLRLLKDWKRREKFAGKYARQYMEDDMPIPPQLVYSLPDDVVQKCSEISKQISYETLMNSRCRFESAQGSCCLSRVDDFINLGYCQKHIHTPQAVLCILKRQRILQSKILIKNLREIVCGWI